MNTRGLGALTVMVSTILTAPYGLAQQQPAGQVSPAEISDLKAQLAEQQKQIEQLRGMLIEQKKLLEERASDRVKPANLGQVASTTPVVPVAPSITPPLGSFAIPSAVRPPAPPQGPTTKDAPGPLQIKIGDSSIIPIGFLDMTSVSRSTNPGAGIGTNFGSIPYGNTQQGALTETRLSPQNSRIGMRIDTGFKDYNVLGYWESDFLGQIGAPPNGGLAVSSNPYPLSPAAVLGQRQQR